MTANLLNEILCIHIIYPLARIVLQYFYLSWKKSQHIKRKKRSTKYMTSPFKISLKDVFIWEAEWERHIKKIFVMWALAPGPCPATWWARPKAYFPLAWGITPRPSGVWPLTWLEGQGEYRWNMISDMTRRSREIDMSYNQLRCRRWAGVGRRKRMSDRRHPPALPFLTL